MTAFDTIRTQTSADGLFVAGPILLLGAPGVGKGTQAQLLMSAYEIPQISTGDLLRKNVAGGTELGKRAQQLMDGGQLVPDHLVNQMVEARLQLPDTVRGFILDGFPRTLQQAMWIDGHLAGGARLGLVAISLKVAYETLQHRIADRLSCPVCRSIYGISSNPPRRAGVCDHDGTPLVQRADDSEEVFRARMETFHAQTAPVIEHYRAGNHFAEVDGDQPVEQVAAAVVGALKRLRDRV